MFKIANIQHRLRQLPFIVHTANTHRHTQIEIKGGNAKLIIIMVRIRRFSERFKLGFEGIRSEFSNIVKKY